MYIKSKHIFRTQQANHSFIFLCQKVCQCLCVWATSTGSILASSCNAESCNCTLPTGHTAADGRTRRHNLPHLSWQHASLCCPHHPLLTHLPWAVPSQVHHSVCPVPTMQTTIMTPTRLF